MFIARRHNLSSVARCSPRPDSGGAAQISVMPGVQSLVVAELRLRSVTVHANPDLNMIDVAQCAPDLHVTVLGAASAGVIKVPRRGDGASVTVVGRAPVTNLRVDGLVSRLEVEGIRSDFDRDALTGRFASAFVGVAENVWPAAELAIVAGGLVPTARFLGDGSKVRTLCLFDCKAPAGIELDDRLRHVHVQRCDLVAFVAKWVALLRFVDCQRLSWISCSGNGLVLRDSSDCEALEIHGQWAVIDTSGLGARVLRCPIANQVVVQAADRLIEIQTLAGDDHLMSRGFVLVRGRTVPFVPVDRDLVLQPGTLADVRHVFTCGALRSQFAMLAWAVRAMDRDDQLLALQVLTAAVDSGLKPDAVWADRCQLARFVEDRPDWEWQSADGAGADPWVLDLRLWLRCVAGGSGAARSFACVLAGVVEPEQFAALVRGLRSVDLTTAERQLLAGILRRALEACAEGNWLEVEGDGFGGRSRSSHSALIGEAARNLAKLRGRDLDAGAADELARYLSSRWLTIGSARALGVLARAGVGAATAALLRLKQATEAEAELLGRSQHKLRREIARQLICVPARTAKASGEAKTDET